MKRVTSKGDKAVFEIMPMEKPMNKMGFYDLMRAGHVKRWHIVNTTRDQTLAEHQYLVIMIAVELNKKLHTTAGVFNEDTFKAELLDLVMGAMFHDSTEIRQGDTPTPAKVFIKEMAGDTIFEKMAESLLPEIPYIGGKLNERMWNIIEMADRIEAAHWIQENKAGIHADMVAKGCWKKMVVTAVRLNWVPQVNEILQSLGMTYIYKEAMDSAP